MMEAPKFSKQNKKISNIADSPLHFHMVLIQTHYCRGIKRKSNGKTVCFACTHETYTVTSLDVKIACYVSADEEV